MSTPPAPDDHGNPAKGRRRHARYDYLRRHYVTWFKRHPVLGVVSVLLFGYLAYELVTRTLIFSRDAYVTSDVIYLAPEMAGPVASLSTADDQAVPAGQILFTIERQPFELALGKQQAALEVAHANLQKAQDEVKVSTSEINAAQAALVDAQKTKDRVSTLEKTGTMTQEAFDNAEKIYRVAVALLNRAQNARVVAQQEETVQRALIGQAQAGVAQAEYDLKRTAIRAPFAGRVAPLRIHVGQYLAVGTPAVALIADKRWRVVVNLPERHLAGLELGQRVLFSLSTDHWMNFHWGTVRSVSPGVARTPAMLNPLPYVEPTTDWVRLPRQFPVEIDMGTVPEQQPLYQGADASVWMLKLPGWK